MSVLFGAITGCVSGKPDSFTTSASAPVLEPTVPAQVQEQAQNKVTAFAEAVDKNRNADAQKLLSPALRARVTPDLSEWVTKEGYGPLRGAGDWQVDSSQFQGKGKKLVLHTHFTGKDGGTYRTNFVLVKAGSEWQIDSLLPPTKPQKPTAASGELATAPGH